MNPRDWFLLGLRLLAIALFLYVGLQAAVALAFNFGDGDAVYRRATIYFLVNGAAAAVLLYLLAPWAANRVYGRPAPDSVSVAPAGSTPADAFVVGRDLLGRYALYSAVTPLTHLVLALTSKETSDLVSLGDWRSPTVELAGYMVFGVVLLVGPKRVWNGLKALRFSAPDSPKTDPTAPPPETPRPTNLG